jgi:hypothetical protein
MRGVSGDEVRGWFRDTGGPNRAQRDAAIVVARQRITNPDALKETLRFIRARYTTVRQLRALMLRWGLELPND